MKLHLRAAVHSLHGYVSSCIKRPSRLLDYLAAILLCGLALVAKLLVPKPTATGFIPFILVAAAFGGVGPALLATVLCALISVDVASFNGLDSVVFVVTGIAAGILFEALRRSQDKQLLALRELAAIHRAAPVMLLIVDQSLRVRKANALSARFSGGDGSMWLGERNVAWYFGYGLPFVNDPTFKPVFEALVAEPAVKAVVLSARWDGELKRHGVGTNLRAGIGDAVRLLRAAGKAVYVVNGVPSFHFDAGRCKFSGRLGFPALCDEPESTLERQLAVYEDDLKAAVTANPGAQLIDTAHMLCHDRTCSMAENGKLLYRDDNHLNINGSRLIGARLAAAAPGLAE